MNKIKAALAYNDAITKLENVIYVSDNEGIIAETKILINNLFQEMNKIGGNMTDVEVKEFLGR